jgi:hypothetical protein
VLKLEEDSCYKIDPQPSAEVPVDLKFTKLSGSIALLGLVLEPCEMFIMQRDDHYDPLVDRIASRSHT